ncbi:class C sortase [Nesterenkonia sp. E16_10]|uniref:class C sortase n=2 Tax=unclassified Nesterenkonia TaxID=2629769 RepID=UPI001A92468D|nr:class C sortase [Nesterenkonia sp. E16_10]
MVSTLIVLGVALMLYPSAAQWVSAWEQRGQVQDYSDAIEETPSEQLAEQLDRARTYNRDLASGSGIIDPFSAEVVQENRFGVGEGGLYRELLAGGPAGVMARLSIPGIEIDLPVFHGTSEATLRRGIGHLEGTALPVGGAGTHSVLTGHRGLHSAELFTHLDELGEGDAFSIEVFGENLSYEVIRTQVVEPHETESLYPEAGRDLLTLVTCTPLGLNTHRILVTAERSSEAAPEAETAPWAPRDLPMPWWALILFGALLLQVIYLWRIKAKQVVGSQADLPPSH